MFRPQSTLKSLRVTTVTDTFPSAFSRAQPRDRMAMWIVSSLAIHLCLLVWLFVIKDRLDLQLNDHTSQDERPAVQVVVLAQAPNATPRPDDNPATDRPSNALPPPVRKIDPTSDLRGSADAPPIAGMAPVDADALEAFVAKSEKAEKEISGSPGLSWTTCSRLSPERRVLEPACDGLMLKRGDGTTVAASLQPPDAATLAAIQKYNPPRTAQDEHDALGTRDRNADTSYSNPADSVYGKLPTDR